MATLFVSLVTHTDTATTMFTLTNQCHEQAQSEDQPSGCKNETSLRKSAKNTKSTKTETFYGSIISTMLASLKDAK